MALGITFRKLASRAGRRINHCLPIQNKDKKINILSPSPPDWRQFAVMCRFVCRDRPRAWLSARLSHDKTPNCVTRIYFIANCPLIGKVSLRP